MFKVVLLKALFLIYKETEVEGERKLILFYAYLHSS